MTASGARSVGLVPNLSPLETSRSIRRSLISPQVSPLSARKSTTPTELPIVSQSKTSGDDQSFMWTSGLGWVGCFVLVTLIIVIVLGTHPLFNDSQSLSLSCSTAPKPSLHSEEESPVELHDSQDSRLGGDEKVDEKCWSRSRLSMYRPSERRFPPSASLTRAVEDYEILHARCTAGMKWESLKEITESGSSQDSCKYLMYIEGPEGLGNRFMSLVSAFSYALITDRVLLLDSRRNMSSLLCEPFEGSSWTLPAMFRFQEVDELPSLDDISDLGGLDKMAAVRLNLRHEQSDRDQRFFCTDVQNKLSKVTFIGWKSNQYYLPRFYTMPEFWAKLNPLFSDPGLVFTQLSRVLLLPQNAVWAKTERIYRAYLASSRKLVGMQVRSPNFSSFERPIQDRVVQCLTAHQALPKISEKPLNVRSETTKSPQVGTTIFVASLQREYYEQIMELYAERGAEDGSLVSVQTVAALGEENQSQDQAVKAFVDMLLLSFSDALATSGWSTFGYVAQGFGAILPHIVNTDVGQAESCEIGQSFEPCAHYPYLSSCPAASMNDTSEHGKWIRKHIRHCQDAGPGIQLVSTVAS